MCTGLVTGTIRFFLRITNLILMIAGLGIVGYGGYLLSESKSLFSEIVMGFGFVLFTVAMTGFWSITSKSRGCQGLYLLLFSVLVIVQTTGVVLLFADKNTMLDKVCPKACISNTTATVTTLAPTAQPELLFDFENVDSSTTVTTPAPSTTLPSSTAAVPCTKSELQCSKLRDDFEDHINLMRLILLGIVGLQFLMVLCGCSYRSRLGLLELEESWIVEDRREEDRLSLLKAQRRTKTDDARSRLSEKYGRDFARAPDYV